MKGFIVDCLIYIVFLGVIIYVSSDLVSTIIEGYF